MPIGPAHPGGTGGSLAGGAELSAEQPTQRPSALWRRAAVRERQGDIVGAMDDTREAIRVIEEMRAKLVPLDFMKQGFSVYFHNVYSTLIGLYVRQGQPEKALEAAELARARAFLGRRVNPADFRLQSLALSRR